MDKEDEGEGGGEEQGWNKVYEEILRTSEIHS